MLRCCGKPPAHRAAVCAGHTMAASQHAAEFTVV